MTDTIQTPECRPRADSVEELTGSAIVLLEPSVVDVPAVAAEPEEVEPHIEVTATSDIELEALVRYEDCPADPTVKMLPDFSVVDDAPTVPRAERQRVTLPPPPFPPRPASLRTREAAQKPLALPPIAPLPAKRPDSLPAPALPPSFPAATNPRERDTERPSRPRPRVARTLAGVSPHTSRGSKTPTLPLDLPRPPAVLEWNRREAERTLSDEEDTERTSVIPVSGAVQVRAARPWTLKNSVLMAGGAVFGLMLFLAALFVLKPASRPGRPTNADALLVTVAGPGGGAVVGPQVFIDGVRRCESSPCLVPGLAEGLHFVTVSATRHVTTSPRVVRVADNEASLLHVELSRDTTPAEEPARERSTAASEPVPVATPAQLPTAFPEPPVVSPAPVPAQPKPAAPVDVGSALLNLNSIPSAGVLLDGQPLGLTPKLNVRVKPGPHVVVFVHPEEGRRARAVMVEAGARQTVAVRF